MPYNRGMITLLMGENSYEVDHELRRLAAAFDGVAEKVDGAELALRQLPDLLMGTSLFSNKRLVMIRGIAQNKSVWETLPDWLGRLNDDIHLVLVEAKPDKRTKTYKALQKVAEVREYKPWGERDQPQAVKWLGEQAAERQIKLSPDVARLLVARVGVNQWQLSQALDKLSTFEAVTEEVVREVIDANPAENVFELFETALKGDTDHLRTLLDVLEVTEDPYMLFGLLSGQAFQLAALAVAREGDDVAKDFGVHPFVVSKLRPYAVQRQAAGARRIVASFAEADAAMKTSSLEPWVAIRRVLLACSRW